MSGSETDRLGEPPEPFSDDHRTRLSELAMVPRALDDTAIAALKAHLAALRVHEDEVGARRLVHPCRHQLALLRQVLAAATGTRLTDVRRLASQYAQFLGWLYTSTLEVPRSTRQHGLANDLARQTGDLQMSGTVVSMLGYAAYYRRDYATTLSASEALERDPRLTPATRALAAQQAARTHATLGQPAPCDHYLEQAERHLERALTHPVDEPPWLYYYSPAHLRMQKGRAYHLLGRLTAAADLLNGGLESLSPPLQNAEWTSPYRCLLASAHRYL